MSRFQERLLTWDAKVGVICINSDTLFMLRNQPHLRGHKYTLTKPRCTGQVRQGFLVQSCNYVEQFTSRHNGL